MRRAAAPMTPTRSWCCYGSPIFQVPVRSMAPMAELTVACVALKVGRPPQAMPKTTASPIDRRNRSANIATRRMPLARSRTSARCVADVLAVPHGYREPCRTGGRHQHSDITMKAATATRSPARVGMPAAAARLSLDSIFSLPSDHAGTTTPKCTPLHTANHHSGGNRIGVYLNFGKASIIC
jgi:hypothetical protein